MAENIQISHYDSLPQHGNANADNAATGLTQQKSVGTRTFVLGMNAIYYHSHPDHGPVAGLPAETWEVIDYEHGGLMVTSLKKPVGSLKVGDLAGFNSDKSGRYSDHQWSIGVIRWIMVKQDCINRVGIQTVAGNITPVDVRLTDDRETGCKSMYAVITRGPDSAGNMILLAKKGLYHADRRLEIISPDYCLVVTVKEVVQSALKYDIFRIVPGP